VFTVDLDPPADVAEHLGSLLPAAEADTSAPIRVARAATRVVLGDALDADPAAIEISRRCEHCDHPTHGRPTVTGRDDISFSLSHSGSLAVIALTNDGATVGVDVETLRPRRRLPALAARIMNDDEYAAWTALDDESDRLRAFLRTWTAKEAYLKALGIGIATRLRDVPAQVDGWSTAELTVGTGTMAALAIDRTDFGVRYLELPAFVTSNGGTAS
jgi:4'-phosphopantetheinyl transferase